MRILLIITLLFLHSDGEIYKLYTEKQPDAQFGWIVDIYGDFAVVGSIHYKTEFENNLNQCGAVFVYKKDASGKFSFFQKILPPNPSIARSFGASISIYNHDLIIGASMEKLNASDSDLGYGQVGAAYTYKFDNEVDKWVYADKIVKGKREDYYRFGENVFIYKNRGIITSIGKKATLSIIEKDEKGMWFIVNSHEKGMKGIGDISLYNNRIAYSKYYSKDFENEESPNFKKVLVGEIDEMGEIVNLKKIIPNQKKSELYFGDGAVELYKNLCFVRSFKDSNNSEDTISFIQNDDGNWITLLNNKPVNMNDCYNKGFVHVFMETADGSWIETQILASPDSNSCDFFGLSISASGDYAIIGAMGDNYNNQGERMHYMGAAYIYKIDFKKGSLSLVKKVEAPEKEWNKFGFSVAVHKNDFIIGSRIESYADSIKNAGGAYIYHFD